MTPPLTRQDGMRCRQKTLASTGNLFSLLVPPGFIAGHLVPRAVHIATAFLFSSCRKRQSEPVFGHACAAIPEILRRKIRKLKWCNAYAL